MGTQNTSSSENVALSAEIVTTGTEILLGEIVDTNAVWMAKQLRDAGINLYYKTTVGDNEQRVRGVIELGLTRSDVIIVSGGLGPTVDDVTRHAIAAATGRELRLNEEALETLKNRFLRFGVQMTDNNRRQALIPQGAILIENPVGTAPGFVVEMEQGTVIAVPGVPREMKHMVSSSVLPYLRERSSWTGTIRQRVLRTIGIGESTLDDALGELMHSPNPTVGLAAHTAQADVRITARAESAADADRMLDQFEARIRDRVGQYIYSSVAEESFETVVVSVLRKNDSRVSIVETNTQGALGQRLSLALPDYNPVAGQWVLGGQTALPSALQGVTTYARGGAPFNEVQARDVAKLLVSETGATHGIAVLGSAGAEEGVYGRESGRTWLSVASADHVESAICSFGGRDEYTIVRIGNQVLRLLWDFLKTTH